jgi:hypothetical protein
VTTTAMVRDRQLLLRAAAPAGAQGQGAGSGAAAAAAAGCVADDAIDDNIHARRPVTVSSAAVDRLMNPLTGVAGPPSFTKVGEINLTNVGRLQGWVGTLILLAPR